MVVMTSSRVTAISSSRDVSNLESRSSGVTIPCFSHLAPGLDACVDPLATIGCPLRGVRSGCGERAIGPASCAAKQVSTPVSEIRVSACEAQKLISAAAHTRVQPGLGNSRLRSSTGFFALIIFDDECVHSVTLGTPGLRTPAPPAPSCAAGNPYRSWRRLRPGRWRTKMLLLADKPAMTTWRTSRDGVQSTATVCLVTSCGELRVSKLSMSLVSVAHVCARHYLLLCSSIGIHTAQWNHGRKFSSASKLDGSRSVSSGAECYESGS